MSKLAWYYNRLKAMGVKEVALRVREHWLHRTEERHFETLSSVTSDELGNVSDFPQLPDRDQLTSSERVGLEDECRQILAGEWHVLRGHVFEVEMPPNWHRDYLCGKDVPERGLARSIDHRSLPEGIDPRIIWETSRWIQLVRLAQLAWHRDDAELAELIMATLEDWVVKNPVGYGINWTSPMEPGIRLTNFTWIHALLSGVGLPEKLVARLDGLAGAIIPPHVWWVWRYHSVGTSANNHLLGEICGLMMALTRWPEATQWCTSFEKLSGIMHKELMLQFANDGGNREQGLHYHLFAWEMGWQAMRAMQHQKHAVDPHLSERMARAGHFFATLVAPEEPWDFGDSDDAHVTPVFIHECSCLVEWQAWFKGEEKGHFLKLWFGEPQVSQAGMRLEGDWQFFPDSGYGVLRSGELMLRLDGSPLGFGSMAAHGHLDALHLSIWFGGEAIVIDPGTGSYFDNREVRDYLLSAQAHNAPWLMDCNDYPVHAGPFLWTNHHPDPLWKFSSEGPSVEVSYGKAKVTRSVRLEGDSIVVCDEVSDYTGEVTTSWMFAPSATIAKGDSAILFELKSVNLTCELDGEVLSFSQGLVQGEMGHCSEFFRTEQWASYCNSQSTCRGGKFQRITQIKLEKQNNEH